MESHSPAFTLIELLVVIAIIAILSIVVVLVLNPTQLLMQSRDSNRLADLANMNTALGIYSAQAGTSLGSSNIVYISIPDPVATSSAGDQCQGLGLPALPASDTYFCGASSTFRTVNGSGWIPVNFTSLIGGSPLGSLPIDPVNVSSSNFFYTYMTNGTQWMLTAIPESQKQKTALQNSPTVPGYPNVIGAGTNLALSPIYDYNAGLAGWWGFDEGSGTVAYDYSGNNATGTWGGTQAGTNGYYSAGKVGNYAGTFNGSNDSLQVSGLLSSNSPFTISMWYYPTRVNVSFDMLYSGTDNTDLQLFFQNGSHELRTSVENDEQPTSFVLSSGNINQWHHIVWTYNYIKDVVFVDGVNVLNVADTTAFHKDDASVRIGELLSGGLPIQGNIDDVRIYGRALSAAEIAAMYNAQK